MKFSHFVELIIVNRPADELYLEICYILIIQDFTGFASTSNTEFEIAFLNSIFS